MNNMSSIKVLTRKISSRLRRKKRGASVKNECNESFDAFPLLDLSDDLIIHILSFVSSAPFECITDDEPLYMDHISPTTKKGRQPVSFRGVPTVPECRLTASSFGTLTHVLPFVCKKFHQLSFESDGVWKEAMERLSVASPAVWGKGISQIATTEKEAAPASSAQRHDASFSSTATSLSATTEDLCEKATVVCGGAKNAFQRIVEVYQPFTTTAPLFLMGGSGDPPVLQQAWNLHLYEPRYRLMMSQIMQSRPLRDKSGSWIASPGRPRFLFSSGLSAPLVEGDPVFLVEILRCKLKRDGRALLTILPVLQTRIQAMHVRPNSFALLDATVQTCKRRALGDTQLRLPVFCISAMGRIPQLFSSIELVVWEDRYRRLVREIMETESTNRPRFILAPSGTVTSGETALLMEVRKCALHPDGTANIELVAIAKGLLRNAVERPNADRLYDANIDIVT